MQIINQLGRSHFPALQQGCFPILFSLAPGDISFALIGRRDYLVWSDVTQLQNAILKLSPVKAIN